ncbi:MAG: hypothetical protein GX451_10470 [Acholeplasmataceae bacterium]|nr:hypothetical protein [Acholeplasmataceae bacterium]
MHKKDFDMPNDIIEAVKSERLVLFAGAGISTEKKGCYPRTFYEEIKQEMDLPNSEQLKFSKIMSKYTEQPNGRRNLIRRIRKRFDYVDSFPELYRIATNFHRELSSVYFIRDIITTNWDDYFERECGATPFVSDEDLIFWDLAYRRVLKIHGTVNNYGSLVITGEDYQQCYERLNNGALGGFLKSFLATKTIIFIGYSFGDEDFSSIQEYLSREMSGLNPHAYVVTIDESANEKFKGTNITPIITDGTFFIEKLKELLIKENLIIPEDTLYIASGYLTFVNGIHKKIGELDLRNNPEVIYSLSYLDGLIHALERVETRHKTGEYSDPYNIMNVTQSYLEERKVYLKNKQYFDVAYIDGYVNGLLFIIDVEELEDIKDKTDPFYLFGYRNKINNFEEYLNLINNGKVYHKNARKLAEKIVTDIVQGITVHHKPFL